MPGLPTVASITETLPLSLCYNRTMKKASLIVALVAGVGAL